MAPRLPVAARAARVVGARRSPLAALAVVAALAAAAAPPGCSGAHQCTANADCPAQSYCVPADGGASGACRQDCRATADCRDPALRCSSLGQCVPVQIPLLDGGADAAPPDDGAPADDATADDGAPPDDAGATD
ncbi:MAG: hypothetical protein HY906_28480 [Deltaproteobacteria bacterium]|nr:hypothetical protein [Deltaproteobacteria bacterium]